MTESALGAVGSAVLPVLAGGESADTAPWWLVLGIGAAGALIVWAVLGQGGGVR